MSNNIPNIPFEIIATEILHRLDLKTLVQCTSICKQWNSLITSPSFISYHSIRTFHSNNNRNESLLFQICHIERDSICRRVFNYQEIYSLHSDNDQIDLLCALENPPIDRFKNNKSFFRVVGSCNGLVCVVDNLLYFFILWNPTLRKYVLLPKLDLPLVEKASLGFGFDSRNNDFKVVKLVNDKTILHQAWVCSFVTRSWKLIITNGAQAPPPCFVHEEKAHMFMNDKLHWIAKHRKGYYNFILTLDLAEEAFVELLLPQRISVGSPMASISVFTRGGLLAVSHIEEGLLPSPILRVWIMKEYGVVESWTKVIKIQHRELIPKNVLTLRKNGEMIIEMRGGKIVKYNPTTAAIEDLGVRGDHVFIGYHGESLFFLDKGQGVLSYKY